MFPATTRKGGVNVTTGPLDACRTPSPAGPVPIPYANLVDGLAASGDEAAKSTQKEIIKTAVDNGYDATSATSAAIAGYGGVTWLQGSSKVKAGGGKVAHMTAMTGHNGASANSPTGTRIAPSQSKVLLMGG